MSAYAKRHIEIGRSYQDKLPKNTHVAFLNSVEAYEWLLELEKYNFNVLEQNLHKQSSKYVKMMMAKGKKGEY